MRTALLLFLGLGTGIGVGANFWRDVRERGEAQRSLLAKPTNPVWQPGTTHCQVYYVPETKQSWFVKAVQALVHPEYERKLAKLTIIGKLPDKRTAVNTSKVFGVEDLELSGEFTEEWVARAVSANGLEALSLGGAILESPESKMLSSLPPPAELVSLQINSGCILRPEFVSWLSQAPKLNEVTCASGGLAQLVTKKGLQATPPVDAPSGVFTLRLNQTSNHDPLVLRAKPIQFGGGRDSLELFLDELRNRHGINCLRIASARIDDAQSFGRFCTQSKIEELQLYDCDISRECLRELAKLQNLKSLHLDWTPIFPWDLPILGRIKSLREIHGLWCGDEEAEAELRASMPECKIKLQFERDFDSQDKDF